MLKKISIEIQRLISEIKKGNKFPKVKEIYKCNNCKIDNCGKCPLDSGKGDYRITICYCDKCNGTKFRYVKQTEYKE